MPPPPSPMLELGLQALLPVLVVSAALGLLAVSVAWMCSTRRYRRNRAAAIRAFAEAAATGSLEWAEHEARRVLSRNDPRSV